MCKPGAPCGGVTRVVVHDNGYGFRVEFEVCLNGHTLERRSVAIPPAPLPHAGPPARKRRLEAARCAAMEEDP
jgi:hypothetical protein